MGTHRKTFTMALLNIKREKQFQDFTDFIMEKLNIAGDGEITDDMRKSAYRAFRTRTGKEDFATLPTIRKWFGAGISDLYGYGTVYGGLSGISCLWNP